jgi:hypothetical protein
VIEFVRDLVRLLSGEVDVNEVAAKVGPIGTDPGWPIPMELRPTAPEVRAARLARYPDEGPPYALTIEPADGMKPTVAELKSAFGDYQRTRTSRGMAPELIFAPPAGGPRWRVAVIARLDPAVGDLDASKVARIVFRRDLTS